MEEEVTYTDKVPQYGRIARGDRKEKPEVHYRIKMWMAVCMLSVSAIIDIIQAVLTFFAVGLVVDIIISIVADFIFVAWFWLLGVPFITSSQAKRFFRMFAQGIAEAIPVVQIGPWLTIVVFMNIRMVRAEDRDDAEGKLAHAFRQAVSIASRTPKLGGATPPPLPNRSTPPPLPKGGKVPPNNSSSSNSKLNEFSKPPPLPKVNSSTLNLKDKTTTINPKTNPNLSKFGKKVEGATKYLQDHPRNKQREFYENKEKEDEIVDQNTSNEQDKLAA